jgi:hypothetical protein
VFAPFDTAAPIGTFGPGWTNVPGQHRCERCGEVAPLGPANDFPPAVQIEIQAARFAAIPEFGYWRPEQTPAEMRGGCGWNAAELGFADTWCNGDQDCLAGYLARCIVETGEWEP